MESGAWYLQQFWNMHTHVKSSLAEPCAEQARTRKRRRRGQQDQKAPKIFPISNRQRRWFLGRIPYLRKSSKVILFCTMLYIWGKGTKGMVNCSWWSVSTKLARVRVKKSEEAWSFLLFDIMMLEERNNSSRRAEMMIMHASRGCQEQ